MRGVLVGLLGLLLGVAAASTSCSTTPLPASDAGVDHVNLFNPDGGGPTGDAAGRLLRHEGKTLSAMQLGIIYVGDFDGGGAPSEDPSLSWLLGSPYWLLLDEYGINSGAVAGSVRLPVSKFLQSGDVDKNGLVDVRVLETRIAQSIQGVADAGITATVSIPGAEAYVIFLPDGLNVALGHKGNYTYQTCVDANGYHGYDGFEPYTVLPPCPEGRSIYAASHELTEMATDPSPYHGWVSDTDIPINGGEVADLCTQKVLQEGVCVTRIWSNIANGCVPPTQADACAP